VLIGLLYEVPSALTGDESIERISVDGSLVQVEQVADALIRHGHEVRRVPYTGDLVATVAALRAAHLHLAFNLVQERTCAALAGVLDLLGVPYTGGGPLAIELTTDKALTHRVLRASGVRVPDQVFWPRGLAAEPAGVGFPAIVKLRFADNSTGLDNASVVHDRDALRKQVGRMWATYDNEVLIESYIEGREVAVALLGNNDAIEILPPREMDFSRVPAGDLAILSHRAKWLEETDTYKSIIVRCPAPLDDATQQSVEEIATAAFAATGCRDYARVDVRIDRAGQPFVIDVNTNPDLQLGAGFTVSGLTSGRTFDRLILDILAVTAGRVGIADGLVT
jgi:D-alanine-D-alanine ligase